MKKFFALSLVAVASLGLTACGGKSNESVEVTNEVDANLTADETLADVNATIENAGEAIDNAVAAGANEAANATEATANAVDAAH